MSISINQPTNQRAKQQEQVSERQGANEDRRERGTKVSKERPVLEQKQAGI
jgi:hypothetical protein